MRYWLDTEFIESGPNEPIYLLSIGIAAEDGREFYGVVKDAPLDKANDWVKENVLPHLPKPGDHESFNDVSFWSEHYMLAENIKRFIGDDPKPEFWGYYADYDWVVFCQIFGAMIDLPKGWPMYCRDIKQWCDQLGNPQLPTQESKEHNALHDARWNREAWEFLHLVEKDDKAMPFQGQY
jgi:hypothetical protein